MNPLPVKVSAMTEGGPSRKRAASSSAKLEVEVVRHDEAWEGTPGLSATMLERAARAGFDAAPPRRSGTYHVTVALTNDAEMRVLNRTWRGKDASTNVLSFPADDEICEPGFLGDVVLAYETTLKEAREQDIGPADHVAHLVVHGVLHLLGFDHADDTQAERMERMERTALASLGIADPYAEKDEARSAEVSS
jgi:probable rRNA maturation factor